VVFVQHLLRVVDVLQQPRALFPWHLDQPVDVVAHHGGFGRHRRHQLQLVDLGRGLVARFLAHPGFGDLLFEFGQFIAALIHVAEFLLNGLHLLVQVVLALALLHLRLDPAADALLDLQHVHLAFDRDQHMFETLADVENLQHLLLLGQLQRHVGRHGVGQATRLFDAGQRRQHLGRHFLVQLHVLFELRDHGTGQHVHFALVILV
jgi:hypothetical protein